MAKKKKKEKSSYWDYLGPALGIAGGALLAAVAKDRRSRDWFYESTGLADRSRESQAREREALRTEADERAILAAARAARGAAASADSVTKSMTLEMEQVQKERKQAAAREAAQTLEAARAAASAATTAQATAAFVAGRARERNRQEEIGPMDLDPLQPDNSGRPPVVVTPMGPPLQMKREPDLEDDDVKVEKVELAFPTAEAFSDNDNVEGEADVVINMAANYLNSMNIDPPQQAVAMDVERERNRMMTEDDRSRDREDILRQVERMRNRRRIREKRKRDDKDEKQKRQKMGILLEQIEGAQNQRRRQRERYREEAINEFRGRRRINQLTRALGVGAGAVSAGAGALDFLI